MPLKAQVLETVAQIRGVCIQSDPVTGKALSIERIAE
jgi:calcineurin-like phosphoesterase